MNKAFIVSGYWLEILKMAFFSWLKNNCRIASLFKNERGKTCMGSTQMSVLEWGKIIFFVTQSNGGKWHSEVEFCCILWVLINNCYGRKKGRKGEKGNEEKASKHTDELSLFLITHGFKLSATGLTRQKFWSLSVRSILYPTLYSISVISRIELTAPYTLILFSSFWIYSDLKE